MLELRGSKIHKEMELKKQQRLFAVMKRKLEALQADCESVDAQVRKVFDVQCGDTKVPPLRFDFLR